MRDFWDIVLCSLGVGGPFRDYMALYPRRLSSLLKCAQIASVAHCFKFAPATASDTFYLENLHFTVNSMCGTFTKTVPVIIRIFKSFGVNKINELVTK
jgi:hypothetical protein